MNFLHFREEEAHKEWMGSRFGFLEQKQIFWYINRREMRAVWCEFVARHQWRNAAAVCSCPTRVGFGLPRVSTRRLRSCGGRRPPWTATPAARWTFHARLDEALGEKMNSNASVKSRVWPGHPSGLTRSVLGSTCSVFEISSRPTSSFHRN